MGRLGGRHVEKCRFFEIRDFLNLIALRVVNMKFSEFQGEYRFFDIFLDALSDVRKSAGWVDETSKNLDRYEP